jgi:hypothetical protein
MLVFALTSLLAITIDVGYNIGIEIKKPPLIR